MSRESETGTPGDDPSFHVWPSTPEERRQQWAWERRHRRYGSDTVAPSVAYSIMAEVIAPAAQGFEQMRPGHYARRFDQEHIDVLWFRLIKGATVNLAWGTSAAYVPTRVLPRPDWPRTLKQARAAIWMQSTEAWRPANYSVPGGAISLSNGQRCVRDDTEQVWRVVGEAARQLWTEAVSPSGMLALAGEQLATPREYELHHPRPAWVAAFAHARLGDLDSAKRQLGAADLAHDADEALALVQALTKVASRA